jgi:hypothetical protein
VQVVKLERARKHINDTADLIRGYLSKTPVRLSSKISDCGQWNEIYISEIDNIDPSISCAIGDALFNLRSFLDHVMMHIVLKYCDINKIRIESIYFPIKGDESKFQKWRNTNPCTKQIPSSVLDVIESFKPYPEGSKYLSALHELNIIDKHRALVVAAINYQSINMLSMMDKETVAEMSSQKLGDKVIGGQFISAMSGLWINDQNCRKVATVGQNVTAYPIDKTPNDPLVKFNFSVIEDEIEVEPVAEFLQKIEKEVSAVHKSLEQYL